jgi:hypothetical protein
MKQKILCKTTWLILLLLVLAVVTVLPAAAQEPDGDVSVQVVDFAAFLWNPAATSVSRGDGTVVQKLDVQGASEFSGLTLAVGYSASVVSPQDVRPGDLLPGTRGVDYNFTVLTGGGALECGGDASFTVNIVYFDPTVTINGSGSVLDIVWRSDPDAAIGDVADICLDGATSLVTDNGGFPGPAVVDVPGTITVVAPSIFTFQIGLEGGKDAGLIVGAVPEFIFTDVKINGIYPCDGGSVGPAGICPFNNSSVPPPYTVDVSRIGYLSAKASFSDPHQSSSIFLLAGDLNKDKVINILDIVLMASVLNQPAGPSTLSQAADFTGAPPGVGLPPAPDGLINIIDLVLVAKNFGVSGPTNGVPPGGTFPF